MKGSRPVLLLSLILAASGGAAPARLGRSRDDL